jgi:hypothetical protein
MARAKNGNGRFDEAFNNLLQAQARLVQAQATLAQSQAAADARTAANEARWIELREQIAETNRLNAERFARIEALLLEHSRILAELPDAVREKMGFGVPEKRE